MARIIQTADLTPEIIKAMPHCDVEWIYNGLDCAVTHEINSVIKPYHDNVSNNTYAFSLALQAPILEMSMRGVKVDTGRRAQVLTQFKILMARLQDQLNTILKDGIGVELSWRSPAQLKTLLYDVMQLPSVKKRNAEGVYVPTVNREALEQLSIHYFAEPICSHILALRDLEKKRQFLETQLDRDGRIRTSYNIAGTNSGRLSSSESAFGTGTNLQNVDRSLRSVFIADEGMKFCNIDLEQGDARNVGAICWNLFAHEDERMAAAYLDACESGDLHTAVCRMAWTELPWTGEPKADRMVAEQLAYRQDTYRQLAKKLGHGTNYYGTPFTMAKHTKVARQQIESFQERYFGAFSAIGTYDRNKTKPCWHNNVRTGLATTGTITTLLGRRRRFWGRPDDDQTLREAIAYEPQSLTADEIDTALLTLWRSEKVQLLLQVHDSILFQYPTHLEQEIVPWAIAASRVPIELTKGRTFVVPTEAKVGFNWGDWDANDNPYGMKKWSGDDDRKQPKYKGLSLGL